MKNWAFIASAAGILATITAISILCQARENHQDYVVLDFGRCVSERRTISFSHGSTVYELKKENRKNCRLQYGTEVEDPLWDGSLTTRCILPRRVGKQKFMVTSAGVDFSSLAPHCKSIVKRSGPHPSDSQRFPRPSPSAWPISNLIAPEDAGPVLWRSTPRNIFLCLTR